ncbi:putative HC-toxin efflux carrier [Parachaetomium inaequale]|uniref:HC-toxin efflux carrier n=1 Tax=Parachaetomium inaequale TaxID=2588326 RepID=A0AAN6SQ94_9PEZI|nr:putative HC-toxin efflux carrier [Parachaetomium inaequale]
MASTCPTLTLEIKSRPVLEPGSSPAPGISRTAPLNRRQELSAVRDENAAGRPIHGIKWFLVCSALYVIAFLYGLDTTIAADIQGPVVEAFGRVDQLAWIGAGFPLGSVAIQLLNGNFYAQFNLKWIFIGGIVVFEIGSVICGAAPNMDALIVGRVFAGAGGSAIYIGELNYFTLLTGPEERGLYISLIGLFWSVGAVIGPVIGGAFAESAATWRWAFYINLVLGAVAAPIYLFYLPSLRFNPNPPPLRERIARFDFLGLLLIGATWILFTVTFTLAGAQQPWSSPTTTTLLVLFGVFLIASLTQQSLSLLTTPSTRAFPARLIFHSRTQILLFLTTACASTSLFVTTYYLPIYFQFVHADTPIRAAVRLLPYIAVTAALSVLSGHLLSRIRYYMPLYLASGVLLTVGAALLLTALDGGAAASQGVVYGYSVIMAVGTGLVVTVGYTVATLTVPAGEEGGAVTVQNVSQLGSTVVCLVVAGQIFQNRAVEGLGVVLEGMGLGEAEIRGTAAGAQSEVFRGLTGEMRERAVEAIVEAIRGAFVLVVVAGGIMVLAAIGMKRERLLFGGVVAAM